MSDLIRQAVVLDPKERDVSLFDSQTGKPLHTQRLVDISALCPKIEKGDRALLLYTEAKRGRIVQFVNEDHRGGSCGLHTFIDEPFLQTDSERPSRWFGIPQAALIKLVLLHAPKQVTP